MKHLIPHSRTLFLSCILSMSAAAAHASPGAWVMDEGQWQVIHTLSYYRSSERFDGLGHSRPQPTYTKREYNPYIEYGLFEHTTIGANLFVQEARSNGQSNLGLADAELFSRTRLWHTPDMVVSIQPMVKIPGLVDDGKRPIIGSDEVDIGVAGLFGYYFDLLGQRHFTEVEMGYRKRFGAPADQYRINATLGYTLCPKWQILAQSFTTLSADDTRGQSFTQSSRDDYDLQKIQLSGVYQFSDALSLQAGGYMDVYGRNTGNGHGVLFAVWHRF